MRDLHVTQFRLQNLLKHLPAPTDDTQDGMLWDTLKLDIQGADADALISAGDYVDHFLCVIGEFAEYFPDDKMKKAEILQTMEGMHMQVDAFGFLREHGFINVPRFHAHLPYNKTDHPTRYPYDDIYSIFVDKMNDPATLSHTHRLRHQGEHMDRKYVFHMDSHAGVWINTRAFAIRAFRRKEYNCFVSDRYRSHEQIMERVQYFLKHNK